MLVGGHMVGPAAGAFHVFAPLAFVCFLFMPVAVLGNRKQCRPSPARKNKSAAASFVPFEGTPAKVERHSASFARVTRPECVCAHGAVKFVGRRMRADKRRVDAVSAGTSFILFWDENLDSLC